MSKKTKKSQIVTPAVCPDPGDHQLPKTVEALFKLRCAGGVGTLVVSYSGSGDSGQFEGISLDPGVKKEYHYLTTSGDISEDEILDEMSSLLTAQYGGWDNNEGSQGSFTLDVESGSIQWHHEENVTQTVDYQCSFAAPRNYGFDVPRPKFKKSPKNIDF